jgi:hypothetical protein
MVAQATYREKLMPNIIWGRQTVELEQPCVAFLIGMRINRLRAIGQWAPIARSMGQMMAELSRDPGSGFLHAQTWISWRNVFVQQYWRSTDDLIRYANNPTLLHRPAWTDFYRRVGAAEGASVGIWHETITIEPGKFECIYGNMPPFGLGAALGTTPAIGKRNSAAERLRQDA